MKGPRRSARARCNEWRASSPHPGSSR
jgi:hypothetical protein